MFQAHNVYILPVKMLSIRVFVPSDINKEYNRSNRLAEHTEEATRLLGELNAYSAIVPDVNFFY